MSSIRNDNSTVVQHNSDAVNEHTNNGANENEILNLEPAHRRSRYANVADNTARQQHSDAVNESSHTRSQSQSQIIARSRARNITSIPRIDVTSTRTNND